MEVEQSLRLHTEIGEIPIEPAILALALAVKRYGFLWAGGLYDQPHITMKELAKCYDVINEVEMVAAQLKALEDNENTRRTTGF